MDEDYVKSIEEENEKLREKLAAAQLELDELKKENETSTSVINWSKFNILSTAPSGVITMQPILSPDTISSHSTLAFYGIDLSKEHIEFIKEQHMLMQELSKANTWKTIKILWTLLVTKKSLKRE